MSRQQKLKALEKKSIPPKLDPGDFHALFDSKVQELASLLGDGVELNNLDALIGELSKVSSIQPLLIDLTNTIKEFKVPDEIQLKSPPHSTPPNNTVKVEWLNKNEAKGLVKKLDKIIQVTEKSIIKSANPSDYVPMRRVMKVGEKLMWDDSFYTGGGGGGGSGGAVTIADGDNQTLGAKADAVASSDTGTFSLVALFKRSLQWLTTIAGYSQSSVVSLQGIESDTDYRYGGGKSAFVTTLAASGGTTLIDPGSGKAIRVFWVGFVPNSDNTSANLIKIGFGSSTNVTTEIYRGYAMAHWEVFTGAVNENLNINAASAEPVAVTIHYMEVTP